MAAHPSTLTRFLRRVYRRLVVVRLLEWAGIGFVIACAIALVAMLVMRNRPESPLTLAAILVGTGSVIGLIAAALRLPKIIDAAIEADRQLDLHDLLSTAWQIERSRTPAQDFEQAVLLIAHQRADQLRARDVILNRLGVRAWSGIGLAGALVLTVGILTANPLDTQAAFSPNQSTNAGTAREPNRRATAQQNTGRRPPAIAQDHPRGKDDPLAGAGQTQLTTKPTGTQGANSQSANPAGTGSGAGQSPSAKTNTKPIDPAATNSNRIANSGQTASGVGRSTNQTNGA